MRVTEIQRGDNLPEELPRLLGRESSLFHEIVEQLTTGNVLQHQISAKMVAFYFHSNSHTDRTLLANYSRSCLQLFASLCFFVLKKCCLIYSLHDGSMNTCHGKHKQRALCAALLIDF